MLIKRNRVYGQKTPLKGIMKVGADSAETGLDSGRRKSQPFLETIFQSDRQQILQSAGRQRRNQRTDGERGMPSWARNDSSDHRFRPAKSTASMYSFLMIVLSNFRIWVHYQIAQNVFQCLGFLDDCFKLGCLIL
jgi:hypothetical protein